MSFSNHFIGKLFFSCVETYLKTSIDAAIAANKVSKTQVVFLFQVLGAMFPGDIPKIGSHHRVVKMNELQEAIECKNNF